MQSIPISDTAWETTFPYPVSPYPEEGLPGLLLRCDERNHWTSRTTLAYLLHPGPEKFHRCWRTESPNLSVIAPYALDLDHMAQAFDISVEVLLATTYQAELIRLYGEVRRLSTKHLSRSFLFHLCPACLAENRLLRRSLILPHITICPQHYVVLLDRCRCGSVLSLFHPQSSPFTCPICSTDWADLPQIAAPAKRIELEKLLLSWYEYFFSKGTPDMMLHASQAATRLRGKKRLDRHKGAPHEWVPAVVSPHLWKLIPLDELMALLMKGSISFQDLFG